MPRFRSRFRNVKCNGYDSKAEWRRSVELKAMQEAGEITELQEQVPFVLIPKQKGERDCKYICDFMYVKDGVTVVEDVKGIKTPDYIIKRKLMLWIHGIRVVEIMEKDRKLRVSNKEEAMKYDKKHEAEEKKLIKKGDKAFIKHEKAEVKAAEKNVKKNVKKGK